MPPLSSELTDEALKQIESGLIENGAEANPDGLNNLMKMLRALSANTTTTRASTTTTTTTTPTTTTTTTTTSTTKAPKMIDQHPLYKTDMLESEDIYHKSIMTMAEASITDEFELTGGRPYIPRSHYRKVEIDALEFELEKSYYELKLAELKYDRLKSRIHKTRSLWVNDQLIESMSNDRRLAAQSDDDEQH